ncbi:MAG TPA: MEDS domain-containing protein [Acidimicrobiales bacterium]|jgi:anti-sigma regulatory factor (Ser/Thr protein kinase)|nr:MEDS domain-containing protein [Acidimicrobiales bacterium]
MELEHLSEALGDHVVYFYDGDPDLVATVSHYLLEGLEAGETAVVVATGAHRDAFEQALTQAGVQVGQATASGRLVWLDAARALVQFTREGSVDGEGFDREIGGLVRRVSAMGRPIRAYGEMVALLWADGSVPAAMALEELWNELRREVPFALFCAYPSGLVSAPQFTDARRQICRLHSSVLEGNAGYWSAAVGPAVPVATSATSHFVAMPEAPGAARRFVVDELRTRGYSDELVHDAALVITELAANALVHAHSAFTVLISANAGVVRISVYDGSSQIPAPRGKILTAQSGRGLGLVDALSDRWGTEPTTDGKVVWAELRP